MPHNTATSRISFYWIAYFHGQILPPEIDEWLTVSGDDCTVFVSPQSALTDILILSLRMTTVNLVMRSDWKAAVAVAVATEGVIHVSQFGWGFASPWGMLQYNMLRFDAMQMACIQVNVGL